MATSSSTVQHDVFIAFSSRDTRYSFVSHLSAAFRRSKISFFVGDAQEEAEAVAVTEAAIEGSKVFVVVFSENYAFSRLSLDTLVKIMERKHNDDVPVVPIFYGDVTSTVVKCQTKRFGEAFSEHRSLYSDQITKWQNCLIETASLSGHESICQPVESELVKEIVADVREKLIPTGLVGFYSRFVEIENLLWKQSKGYCRLGIWGMPGIGKTTIAQAAFDLLSPDFEVPCFLKDFHASFHEKGSYKMREDHRYKVPKGQKERVLVVLDDVRNPMDAEAFLGGFDCFGPGSVVIITSRDKQVLSQCQVEDIYTVPGLNEREALQLFIRSAFRGRQPSEINLVDLSKKVIEDANGNPKALCLYGTELKKKRKDQMEEAFQKIKGCPHVEIMDLFKSSYDALSETERNIFLDIACFFKGEPRDHVMRILEGCAFFPHVGVNRLAELSLLTISETERVEMHSLVQEVGREIANRETKLISRRRRLWEPSSIINLLLEDKESKGNVIEGIFLDTTNLNVVVNPMAFENMYILRLLKIYSSSPEAVQELHLPNKLHYLPYELRLLHWEKYPLKSLPQEFDPSHLVELNMPYSRLKNLWGGTKSLGKLKVIILSHSQQLVEVDELSEACGLEKIDLQGCSSLKSIPHTDQLKNLQLLNISGCTRIKRTEVEKKIKGLDQEGGLKETKSESMMFSTLAIVSLCSVFIYLCFFFFFFFLK
ncbi:BnaC09g19000D [Brassica napus]|uniref:BnaC09g19000D protein n=1 Tax=Brassica napus TaxID=3708 RepID=A0A078GCP0_BRANA|nr:BnaC09g19000D [Brassica napus]